MAKFKNLSPQPLPRDEMRLMEGYDARWGVKLRHPMPDGSNQPAFLHLDKNQKQRSKGNHSIIQFDLLSKCFNPSLSKLLIRLKLRESKRDWLKIGMSRFTAELGQDKLV
ncbi:hypothetical protein QJS10_CPB11g00726 [Acorus calamus]|uniref:Uncharacterized protein n=1 Tax=Acorus calamus TaxID=4465 RepID=A0AAV9DT04_ACOCL|nr:hypothetical protein QJS10_CPB11g00726 [Acorus calamus]